MATSAAAPIEQFTYGTYGVVTILERAGSLVQIETSHGDFWVKQEKLKPVQQKKIKTVRPSIAVPQLEHVPAIASEPYVQWLLENGCTIEGSTPERFLPRLARAYEQATGEPLPDPETIKRLSVTPAGKQWSYTLDVETSRRPPVPPPNGLVVFNPTPYRYQVHGNAFVMDLLAMGLRFGRNKGTK